MVDNIIIMLKNTCAYKWMNGQHISSSYWRGQQFQYSSYSATETNTLMLSLFKTFDSALMFENVCKIHVQCDKNCSAPYIGVKEAYGIKDTCKLKKITILTY